MSDKRLARHVRAALATTLALALLAGLAVLAERHRAAWDWTAVGRNTLSERSLSLLAGLQGEIEVIVFASEDRLRRAAATELLSRYERAHPRFDYRFVDPARAPELARELGVTRADTLVVRYGGQREQVRGYAERNLSAALERLARRGERWIVFLGGHGERSPAGDANFDLGRFGEALTERGFRVRTLDLATSGAIPRNTALLVLADPRVPLPPGAVEHLLEHLRDGGNLLWLREPGGGADIEPLAALLGVQRLPGVIHDPASASLYRIEDPRVLVVGSYPSHPLLAGLDVETLFPGAAALALAEEGTGFTGAAVLRTGGAAERVLADGTREAAAATGWVFSHALRRQAAEREQRVLVSGDTDFLANAYVGNGANLQLGLEMVRWLTGADELVGVKTGQAPDLRLELSQPMMLGLAFGALFVLPALLLGAGFVVWFKRHRR